MQWLFKIILALYPRSNLNRPIPWRKYILLILSSILYISQFISLIRNSQIGMTYYSSYKKFWIIASSGSIDIIFSSFSIASTFLLLSIIFILLTFALLSIHLSISICKKTVPKIFLKFLRLLLFVSADMMLIPFAYSAMMIIKYSYNKYDIIEEYPNNELPGTFDYGVIGIIGGGILAVLLFFETLLNAGFNFEIRHKACESNALSKAHTNIEFFSRISLFFLSIMYPFITSAYDFGYLCAIIGYSLVNVWYYTLNLPYYSNLVNYVHIFRNLEVFAISSFYFVGHVFDNATIVLVLSIFFQPLIAIIAKELIDWRLRKLSQQGCSNTYSRSELAFRKYFIDRIWDIKIIKKLNLVYRESKNNLVLVVQAYYCLDALKNNSLAAIKVSRASKSSWNIISNYQVFKCIESIKSSAPNISFGVKVCSFLEDLNSILEKDKKLCIKYLKFLKLLLEGSSSQTSLEKMIKKSDESIESVRKSYKRLLESYSNSAVISRLYGSFSVDVLGKEDIAKVFNSRSDNEITTFQLRNKQNSIFNDELACIFIISGNSRDLGKILNVSQGFCTFLEIDQEEIHMFSLADLIPQHKDFDVDFFMLDFIENSDSQYLFNNQLFFFKDKNGFLKECIISTECIAIEHNIKLVSVIEPLEDSHEVAILYPNGSIISHSKGLPNLFNSSCLKIEDFNMAQFIQHLNLSSIESGNCHYIKDYSKGIIYSFEKLTYKRIEIILFYAITDKSEIVKIEKTYDISSSRKDTMGYESINLNFKLSKHAEDQAIVENNEMNKNLDKDTNLISVSSKQNFKDTFEYKYIERTIKVFSFMKILLLLTALIIILANIVMCVMVATIVSNVSPLDSYLGLGQIGYDVAKVGLFIRDYDLSKSLNMNPFFNLSYLNNTINDLELNKNLLKQAGDYYSFCPEASFIQDSIINEIDLKSYNSTKKINLYDYVEKTITHGNFIINKIQNEQRIDSESYCFLLLNSYFSVTTIIQNGLYDLSICEINRIEYFKNLVQYINIAWISAIYFLYSILLIFIFFLSRRLNIIWKLFFKKIHKTYSVLKGMLISRLANTHNFTLVEELDKIIPKSKSLVKNKFLNYSVRIFILILLSSALLFVFVYVFYSQINTSVLYRKRFTEVPLNREISTIKNAFAVLNGYGRDYPIQDKCMNRTTFGSYASEFAQVQSNILKIRKRFLARDLLSIMPPESWQIVFGAFPSTYNFTAIGTSPAIAFMQFETFYYWSNSALLKVPDLKKFICESYGLSLTFSKLLDRTQTSTMLLINSNLKNLIAFSTISTVFTVLATLIAYIPYFKNEISFVRCIQNSLSRLPEELIKK